MVVDQTREPYFHVVGGEKIPLLFIETQEGKYHRLLTLDELAGSLAKQVRYNGHTIAPWSIARHSYVVANEVKRRAERAGLEDRAAELLSMAGLLHDAGEAIIGDIISPVKAMVKNSAIRVMEEECAFQCFKRAVTLTKKEAKDWVNHVKIGGVHPLQHPLIKRVDLDAMTTEMIILLGVSREQACAYGGEPFLDDNSFKFETNWREDKAMFLSTFIRLGGKPW